MEVVCPYCQANAELVDSAEVYSKSYGMIWLCRPCNASVGVHKTDGKNRPLGTLANTETRHARYMAHMAFDPIWRAMLKKGGTKGYVRGKVYGWLAGELEIDRQDCHIAMFDLKTCVRAIEICAKRRREEAASA